jgi:predicted O-linked N-acetylglucosamine transferase (SPINDLY family)
MNHHSDPPSTEALLALADRLSAAGRPGEAAQVLATLVKASPGDPTHLRRLGTALLACKDYAAAGAVFGEAVKLDPLNARGHNNWGQALFAQGDAAAAAACYARAIDCDPRHAGAHNNLGRALLVLNRFEEAVEHLSRAIELAPSLPQPHINLGGAWFAQGDGAAAARCYERALEIDPDAAEAWYGQARIAVASHRLEDALEHLDRALQLRQDFVEALILQAQVLRNTGATAKARSRLETAVATAPRDPAALNELAMLLGSEGDLGAARDCLMRLESLAPGYPYLSGYRLYADLGCAEWEGFAQRRAAIERGVEQGLRMCTPFQAALTLSAAHLQRKCAEIYVADRHPPQRSRGPSPALPERLRIGYLSADFHDHATAHLMAGLFETHDRRRFDIVALSIGPPRDDWMHRRLLRAFGHIEPLQHLSDREAALRIEALEVHVLVDLKGHTLHARPAILSHRPAPLQVNYLGFPGTLGAPYVDYLIADAHLIPPEEAVHYSESIVHLPGCYQVNDRTRAIDRDPPARAECGLAQDHFVYCCFNSIQKINPDIFGAWMRILARVPRSVLWLLGSDPIATANLRKQALGHGISPERLVFAPHAPHARHLARYGNADLFLDTTPYNAHTTGSDALFAGCPLLSLRGSTFAGRVGASLLHAVGMPDLIARSLPDYEAQAIELGTDRARLAALKQRLAAVRGSAPLFDTLRFTRELESAYAAMGSRYAAGLPPAPFAVAPGG